MIFQVIAKINEQKTPRWGCINSIIYLAIAPQDLTNPHEAKWQANFFFSFLEWRQFYRTDSVWRHYQRIRNYLFAIVFKSVVSAGDVFIVMFRIRLAVVVVISWEKWHFVCDLTATELNLFTVYLNQIANCTMENVFKF